MKIHGLCLIKNEADIVEYSLRENARWCDFIHVYDNGSADGTMERLNDLAKRCPQIIPFGTCTKPFSDGLRADVFNHFKSQAAPGDDHYVIEEAELPRHLESGWHRAMKSVMPSLGVWP